MVKQESPFDQAEGAVEAVRKTLESRDKRRRNKFIIGRGVILSLNSMIIALNGILRGMFGTTFQIRFRGIYKTTLPVS